MWTDARSESALVTELLATPRARPVRARARDERYRHVMRGAAGADPNDFQESETLSNSSCWACFFDHHARAVVPHHMPRVDWGGVQRFALATVRCFTGGYGRY